MKETAAILRNYIGCYRLDTQSRVDTPLFLNQQEKLTRQGITYILQKYAESTGVGKFRYLPISGGACSGTGFIMEAVKMGGPLVIIICPKVLEHHSVLEDIVDSYEYGMGHCHIGPLFPTVGTDPHKLCIEV